MTRIRLDLNDERFQAEFFALEPSDLREFMRTLSRLQRLDWEDLYRTKGLNWELIQGHVGPTGQRVYSLRVSKKFRAVAFRQDDFMRFVSLHPDHDSAY